MEKIRRFLKDEEGIEFVEWALMCAGFAMVVYLALGPLAGAVKGEYTAIQNAL